MAAPTLVTPLPETFGELLRRLGGISPDRVRLQPPPGNATPQDVLEIHARTKRLCELVDGVLVEKGMGYRESMLAAFLIQQILNFLQKHDLGLVAGEAGMMMLNPGLVRMPDVSFVSWSRLPSSGVPSEPIPDLAPDLAVEVLSPSNTRAEMARKRREYFAAGVRQVWQVDPDTRTVAVYTAPEQVNELSESDVLGGADVLPGFALPVKELFARLDRQNPAQQ